jgi:VWFA-related protein
MSKRTALGLLAAVVFAGSAALFAQAQQTPGVTFQVEVNYVDVDVVVTDESGQFVSGLKREDFEVFEDGKPQKIDTFGLVDIPVVRPTSPAAPEVVVDGRTVRPDTQTNREPFDGRVYVFVLDDLDVSAMRSTQVRDAARKFVTQHMSANDLAAVVYTSGRTDAAQEFTTNRDLLIRAIDKFQGRRMRSLSLERLDDYYQRIAFGYNLQNNPDPGTGNVSQDQSGYGRTSDPTELERGTRALNVLDTLKNTADFLGSVRGRRKAVMFFSEGLDYPIRDVFAAHDATTIIRATQDVISTAARANVNLYSIDPRGLAGMTTDFMESAGLASAAGTPGPILLVPGTNTPVNGITGASGGTFDVQNELMQEFRLSQDTLREFAEQTGGIAAVNTNNVTPTFERIVDLNSRYYLLGYYPPTHPRNGRFHKIEVRVKRPGLRVEARRGYAEPRGRTPEERKRDEAAKLARDARRPDGKRTSTPLLGVLTSPMQQSGLAFSVSAAPFKNTAAEASVALTIEIEGSRLQFGPPNDKGQVTNKIELSFYGLNEQGKALSAGWSDLDLTLRPETRDRVTAHGVRVNPRINLPPGRYQVRVGARESVGGQMGSVFYDLDVPDFRKEKVMVGGLLLTTPSVQQTPSIQPDQIVSKLLPAPATSRREFPRNDVLALYTEIYDNDTSRQTRHIDVTVRLVSDSGTNVIASRDELVNGTAGEKPWEIFGYAKQIPLKELAPGRYVLRVEAAVRGSDAPPAARDTLITVRP